MLQNAKLFSERLNHCLDEIGAPASIRERAVILSKIINVSKQQAWGLLEGTQLADEKIMQKIAIEFEIDPLWLAGEK